MTHSKPSVGVCRSGKLHVRASNGDPYDVLLYLPTGSLVIVDGKIVYEESGDTDARKRTVKVRVPEFQADTVVKVRARPLEEGTGV